MITVTVLFYVCVGLVAISLGTLGVSIAALVRTGKKATSLGTVIETTSANTLESARADIDAAREQLTIRLEELAGNLAVKVQSSREGTDSTVRDTAACAIKKIDKMTKDLLQASNEVQKHMSLYSAVLESQDRLVKAVAKLTENIESPTRRHR